MTQTAPATSERRLISICVPVYNEENNIFPFHERVSATLAGLADRYDFEILFSDNHSADRTFERLVELSRRDPRVRVIRFSKNFGFQRSILSNYLHARGAAAMQIDVDLQDPPELFAEFLRLWEEGYKVVYGVRRSRPEESALLTGLRKAFYRLIDFLSEDDLPHDAGDFRLIDRCIIEQLRSSRDQHPYLRGQIASFGFAQTGIVYDRAVRERGRSNFNLFRLFGLALDGVLQHSTVPLRLATLFGLLMSFTAAATAIYYVIARIVFHAEWPEGYASVAILILFSIGMNALLLGIIGEYVGRIHKNVRNAPLAIVETAIDNQAIALADGGEARASAGTEAHAARHGGVA